MVVKYPDPLLEVRACCIESPPFTSLCVGYEGYGVRKLWPTTYSSGFLMLLLIKKASFPWDRIISLSFSKELQRIFTIPKD